MTTTPPPVGSTVAFLEGTRPYARNADRTFVVVEAPDGDAWSVDNTHDDGPRLYVWLVDSRDVDKTPSRQRRRSGYASDLAIVTKDGE